MTWSTKFDPNLWIQLDVWKLWYPIIAQWLQILWDLASYISTDIAQVSAKPTFNLIPSLIKGFTNSELKRRCKTCYESYDNSIYELDPRRKSLASGDYCGVNVHAGGAYDDAEDCKDTFDGLPSILYQIQLGNQNLEDLSGITLVISNLLDMK